MSRRGDPIRAPSERSCASCGRRIEWRRGWADSWDEVRYCSAACRRRGIRPVDRALESELERMLRAGAVSELSEAARAVARRDGVAEADLRETTRRAARRLVAAGVAEMVHRGRVVDPSTARGPVGLRHARAG